MKRIELEPRRWSPFPPPPEVHEAESRACVDQARDRALLVVVLVVVSYVILAFRAVPLMLMPDDRLAQKAADQFTEAELITAPRGEVLARDGAPLATTVDMPALYANPKRLSQKLPALGPDELAARLAPYVDTPEHVLADRLSRSGKVEVPLARQVDPDHLAAIAAIEDAGVLFTRDIPARFYPGRSLAAQVLGLVSWDGRGQEGVERSQEETLRGATYKVVMQRDRRGRALSTDLGFFRRAQSGDTVVLTLDRYVQQVVEDALDGIMERSEPLAATAVVLDVDTFEVLAMASRPTLNLNDRAADLDSLKNYAVAETYEPGSVLKPFVVALALQEELVQADTMMDCEGGAWRVGRRTIHDDHPHKMLNVGEVLKYSSNICSAKLALELGAEVTLEGLRSFGFGAPTGIGLPREQGGTLRAASRIKPIELATTSYGQGMTSTALQLAVATGTLANGGERLQPLIVKEIRDRAGHVSERHEPRVVERVLDETVADTVIGMLGSVMEEGGTGQRIKTPGYRAGGKTGTAQKVVDGRYSPTARMASFIGVAPVDDPQVVIVVTADTPRKGSRYGGTVAGPAFAEITTEVMRYLGVPQVLEEGEVDAPVARELVEEVPVVAPELAWTPEGLLRLPDLTGLSMRDTLATLDGAGFELALAGSGVASEQRPPAGTPLAAGERVEIRFQ